MKHSEETKHKISETLKRKGIKPPNNKGKKLKPRSLEHCLKLSIALTGRKFTDEHKNNLSKSHIGNKNTEKTREKISKANKAEKHWNWKNGISGENSTIRRSREYKKWRTDVFKRDNYTCIFCKQVGGKLEADHIKPFSNYPKLRFDIDNGRTVCRNCHKKYGYNWGAALGKKRLAEYGRKGGLKVLEKYGKEYFSIISRKGFDKDRGLTITAPILVNGK